MRGRRYLVRVELHTFLHVWLNFAYSMDKTTKLNIFYNPADAQGILVAANTKATTSGHVPPATTITTLIPSPASIVKMLTLAPKMDQFVDYVTILLVG